MCRPGLFKQRIGPWLLGEISHAHKATGVGLQGRECIIFSSTSQLRGDMAYLGFGVVQPSGLFREEHCGQETGDRRGQTEFATFPTVDSRFPVRMGMPMLTTITQLVAKRRMLKRDEDISFHKEYIQMFIMMNSISAST